ncbi:hypothetical protein BACT_1268 [Bifidobacterium actinocoloniiforme DSM 22766]|uniref:Uncharacterized protein n=1 Tax=Bifidobacterium actinocoloniiforme DSM 22766 TaxID=1437605 RepID=A0A086Z214_9BIFI|nr:hypothetical protein BACT_1268 [Bifidobacterium actinocoloniiforme DSM 22766]
MARAANAALAARKRLITPPKQALVARRDARPVFYSSVLIAGRSTANPAPQPIRTHKTPSLIA